MSPVLPSTQEKSTRNRIRNRVVADAAIRLIDAKVLKPPTGRHGTARLMQAVSLTLKVPISDLREAWLRLDTYRTLNYDPEGEAAELAEAVAAAADAPTVGV